MKTLHHRLSWLQLLVPHEGLLIAAIVAISLVGFVADLAFAFAVKIAFDAVQGMNPEFPLFSQLDIEYLIFLPLLVGSVRAIVSWLQTVAVVRLTECFKRDVRLALVANYSGILSASEVFSLVGEKVNRAAAGLRETANGAGLAATIGAMIIVLFYWLAEIMPLLLIIGGLLTLPLIVCFRMVTKASEHGLKVWEQAHAQICQLQDAADPATHRADAFSANLRCHAHWNTKARLLSAFISSYAQVLCLAVFVLVLFWASHSIGRIGLLVPIFYFLVRLTQKVPDCTRLFAAGQSNLPYLKEIIMLRSRAGRGKQMSQHLSFTRG